MSADLHESMNHKLHEYLSTDCTLALRRRSRQAKQGIIGPRISRLRSEVSELRPAGTDFHSPPRKAGNYFYDCGSVSYNKKHP
jgi:hypothetical protein